MSFKQTPSVLKAKNRPTTRLDRSLEKNLMAYAAAATAGLLSLAPCAEAEVVYTPSNIPMAVAFLNQGPALTQFDLNNDGIPDFTFSMLSTQHASTRRALQLLKVAGYQSGNKIVSVPAKIGVTAAAVPTGGKIGSQAMFASSGVDMAIRGYVGSFIRSSGSWLKVETAYVGLKFLINGQVHYGWARIKFPQPGEFVEPSIYGYAYETIPNQPIVAGQTSGTAQPVSASAPGRLGVLAAGASGVRLQPKQDAAPSAR